MGVGACRAGFAADYGSSGRHLRRPPQPPHRRRSAEPLPSRRRSRPSRPPRRSGRSSRRSEHSPRTWRSEPAPQPACAEKFSRCRHSSRSASSSTKRWTSKRWTWICRSRSSICSPSIRCASSAWSRSSLSGPFGLPLFSWLPCQLRLFAPAVHSDYPLSEDLNCATRVSTNSRNHDAGGVRQDAPTVLAVS